MLEGKGCYIVIIIVCFLIYLGYLYVKSKDKHNGNLNKDNLNKENLNEDNHTKDIKPILKYIESDKFNGLKNGYIFKKDTKGIGYYLDK